MEILNVGPLELFFIVLLALILLGPNRTVEAMRNIGRMMYRVVRSPYWTDVITTTRDIREFPTRIVREAGLEESMKELEDTKKAISGEIKDFSQEVNQEVNQDIQLIKGETIEETSQGTSPGEENLLPGEETPAGSVGESTDLPANDSHPVNKEAGSPPEETPID